MEICIPFAVLSDSDFLHVHHESLILIDLMQEGDGDGSPQNTASLHGEDDALRPAAVQAEPAAGLLAEAVSEPAIDVEPAVGPALDDSAASAPDNGMQEADIHAPEPAAAASRAQSAEEPNSGLAVPAAEPAEPLVPGLSAAAVSAVSANGTTSEPEMIPSPAEEAEASAPPAPNGTSASLATEPTDSAVGAISAKLVGVLSIEDTAQRVLSTLLIAGMRFGVSWLEKVECQHCLQGPNICACEQVKELRNKSGAGMMDCKKALAECAGDIDSAAEYLRKKGLVSAGKKAGRIAAEGAVASYIHAGAR